MSVATIGVVDYTKALDNLSLKQAQLMLTTQGIVGEEQKELLVKQGLIATSDRMSASLVSESLANNGLNKEKQEELLIDLGLMNQNTKELISENAVTESKLRAILAEKGIKGAKQESIVTSILQTGQNGAEAISFDVLTASIWGTIKALAKFLITNPAGWAIIATTAILGLVTAYEASRVSVEEAKEKLEETESSLSEVNSKLEENKQRIEEINALETPSITDKEDLERLKEENKELEIRQKYLEKQKQLDQQQLVQSSKDEYNQKYGQEANEKRQKQAIKTWGVGHENANTSGDIVQEQIDEYKQLQDRRKEILAKDKDKITEQESKELEELNKKLGESELALINTRTELQGFRDDLSSTGESSPELESVKSDLEDIDNLLLSPGEKLVEFINSDVATNDKEKIIELAKTGKLTADVMENQFSNVDKYLKENGLTLEDLISILDLYKDNVEETGQAIAKSFSKEEMISQLNNMSEGFEELDKIYASIKDSDPFDFKLLDNDNFKETFGGLGDVYTDFIEQVTTTPNDINACQSAFDNLLTAWINSTKILDGVTEENSKLTASMLKQMGVANAEELVADALAHKHANLAAQKYLDAGASDRLANATSNEIEQIFAEAEAAGVTRESLARMYLAKLDVANLQLNTQGEIDQIIALANAAGTSAQYVNQLRTALANLNNAPSPDELMSKPGGATKYRYQQEQSVENLLGKIKNQALNASSFYAKSSGGGATYGGGSTSNKDSGSGDSSKNPTEDFNWIERAIQKVQRTITNLGKTVSATYKTWATRNDALKKQISAVNDEIAIQQKAYETYMSQANSLGLDSSYISKIQDGTMSIETITDEVLIDKIKKYQELYDQSNDAQDAISDLRDELANLAKQRFDNVAQEFENQISSVEHEINMLESYIDQTEAKGYLVSTKYYSSLAKTQRENIALLESEYASLNSALTEAMNTGKIEKYSDDWYDMMSQIQGVKEELVEANTALIEYNNSLRELEWERFDKGQEMISDLIAESEFLRDLMSDEKMFDEKGNATEFGNTTFGLHAVDYNTYMSQADDYAKEILRLNEEIAKDPNNQLLLDRRRELIESHRDMIKSADGECEAMKSLAEEGYNTMLDYMNKLIDKRKSALNEMKSLSDYEKTISDQAQTVSELRKIQMALQNDSSESGQLALQQNAVKLKEAEEALRQSELDRQIEEEQKMLDNFADDAENWVSQRLDNTDQLISDVVESTNTNSESIKETLETVTDEVGTSLSNEMLSIWSGNDGIKSVVSMYGDNFNTNVTTVNNTLLGIKSLLESMVKEADKDASDNITEVTNPSTPTQSTSTTTPTPTPAPSTPSTTTTPSSTSSSSTGTIKVGGRINASGAKIYDYAGDTSGESQYYKSDPYYIVLDEQNNYLKVRHHSLKSGVTGWFKKSDVKAYKTGGLVDYTGLAWVDGQKKKPEAFLNARDTENIGELKDVLKEVDPLLTVEQIREFTSTMDGFKPIVESMVKRPNFVPSTSMNQNVTIHNEFTLHEVQNGEQVIDYLQRSKRFENIMYDIAFNKNSLAKYRW